MLSRLHAAGQSVFLALDSAFNRICGERLNPLYYLGAVSYWMLWIVIGSGLYIYAFYRTGVATTYASVEMLTHGQWYLGGIMRSLHRYASDAMVLTMLLHALRNFVFDVYRGFRAFSWITGVVALWLVYVSGVNGYMLPWDRLAQFVVTATAEWLDALPVFGGVLVRNFTDPAAITDRFFSLLSFLHIGIPLAVVALLWVHTQRVPHARTMPPRPLAWGLLGALLVLSLAKPALSQGEADLMSLPATLDLDWFYLAVYPLIYSLKPASLWMIVGGTTLLLISAPWLPPRRPGGGATCVTLLPQGRTVTARPGETLLDAGLREGAALPYVCRKGGCGVCKATLASGCVNYGSYQKSALSDAERATGKLLLCCATPLGDVEIVCESLAREAARAYNAHVAALERLNDDVMLVRLQLDGAERIRYAAGQFVNIVLEDGERRAYSLTAAAQETGSIELHIRRIPGGRYSTHVFEAMRAGDAVRLEGPLGSVTIEDSTKPLVLVAGATGFAPVKSLLEHAFEHGWRRPLVLYWGVRRRRDLYMAELPERWQREHANFRYVPVLSEAAPEDDWTGRTGLVHEAILSDIPDLSGYEMYVCGSLKMVEAARPAFIASGLHEDACYTDSFVSSVRTAEKR